MQEELDAVRLLLKKPKLEFIKVAQEEFLIDLKITEAKKLPIPDNWLKVSSTRATYRFRSPGMQKKMQEIEQARETLASGE